MTAGFGATRLSGSGLELLVRRLSHISSPPSFSPPIRVTETFRLWPWNLTCGVKSFTEDGILW